MSHFSMFCILHTKTTCTASEQSKPLACVVLGALFHNSALTSNSLNPKFLLKTVLENYRLVRFSSADLT